MMDKPAAVFEKFKNSGYGEKEVNDFLNDRLQRLQFSEDR